MSRLGWAIVFGGTAGICISKLQGYNRLSDRINQNEQELSKLLNDVMHDMDPDNETYRFRAKYYYSNEFRRQRNTPMWLKVHRCDYLTDNKDIMDHEIYGSNIGIVAAPSGKN